MNENDGDNGGTPIRNRKGQFEKGSTANKRGRPIKDLGRSEVPDQFVRDFLSEMSEPTPVRSPDGTTVEVPYTVALIKMMKAKVAKSDDVRHGIEFLKFHNFVLAENEKKLPNNGNVLTELERMYLTGDTARRRELSKLIRRLRNATRRE